MSRYRIALVCMVAFRRDPYRSDPFRPVPYRIALSARVPTLEGRTVPPCIAGHRDN